MAVTSLNSMHTAYHRTSQTQTVRTTVRQGGEGGVAKGGGSATSAADSLTISDPVAFANRVMQDKVIKQLNDYLAETPDMQPIGQVDPSKVTPEGTAKFIVDMATGFYNAYSENHKDEADKEKLDGFMNLIRGGVEKGFEEARGILEALNVLNFGQVGENVDKTYDLVQKGLDDFYNSQMSLLEQKQGKETTSTGQEAENQGVRNRGSGVTPATPASTTGARNAVPASAAFGGS